MTVVSRRLPSIRFLTGTSGSGDTLPRMDVAYFVGFARRGPIDTPVALESYVQFLEHFGGEVELAFDPSSNSVLKGNLPGTVRQFFANGGLRCWVMRVLDIQKVRKNHFAFPSLLEARFDTSLKISPVESATRDFGSWSDSLRLSTQIGRLHLQCTGGTAKVNDTRTADFLLPNPSDLRAGDLVRIQLDEQTQYLLPVNSMTPKPGSDLRAVMAVLGPGVALRRLSEGPSTSGECRIGIFDRSDGLTWTESRTGAAAFWIADNLVQIYSSIGLDLVMSQGTVGRIRWTSGATAWMRVLECQVSQEDIVHEILEVRLIAEVWDVAVTGLDNDLDLWLTHTALIVDRIRLDLYSIVDGVESLVTDLSLANAQGIEIPPEFPLLPPTPSNFIFPLGEAPDFFDGTGPLSDPAPALERDGLASFNAAISASMFLDSNLRGELAPTLAAKAEAQAFLCMPPEDPPVPDSPTNDREARRAQRDRWADRQLRKSTLTFPRGVHALLAGATPGPSSEATLVSVPDVVHPNWEPVGVSDMWWNVVVAPPEPDAPIGEFHVCQSGLFFPPYWYKGNPPGPDGRLQLNWNADDSVEESFELQESVDPSKIVWETVYVGESSSYVRQINQAGLRRYRVRAIQDGIAGAWSSIAEVLNQPFQFMASQPDPQGILSIHRAILRTASARGDVMAILSLPVHWRWEDAANHARSLRDSRNLPDLVPSINPSELHLLSQGILVHPWIRTFDDIFHAVTPEGAVAGLLASTAIAQGAWISPGRKPLFQVMSTDLLLAPGDEANLRDAQVCPIGMDPQGAFMNWWDTLSEDPDDIPSNVRRFLGLLRRLCKQTGEDWVFEPSGPVLERSIERAFLKILGELHRRGAMRGIGEGSSYRVDVQSDSDSGILRVDLRVAPSIPLTWLVLSLTVVGERLLTEETR